MPGPTAPIFDNAIRGAALESVDGAMNPASLRQLIAMTDALHGVVLNEGQFGNERQFGIDSGAIGSLVTGPHQLLIAAAVARANCDPATLVERGSAIRGAAVSNIGNAIAQVAATLPGIAKVAQDLTDVFSGATPKASWWGVECKLTGSAAVAVCNLVGNDLNAFLAALVPVFPNAAILLAVTVPAGAALKVWIEAVQGGDKSVGVTLELLLWVVPWVRP
jgi:hypothetical protein